MSRIVFIWLLLLSPFAYANMEVENPERSHGYFIGDVLTQRINLDTNNGIVSPANLEYGLRINDYLHRLPAVGNVKGKKNWLELRYQIINSPQQTATIALPAISFLAESGGEVVVQPWAFSVSSLLASGEGDSSSPLPDHQAIDVIDKPSPKLLTLLSGILLATLAFWILWWTVRHFEDSVSLPFAKANTEINRIPKKDRDSDERAWVAMHRAFNQIAGKTVSRESVGLLFSAAPWLNEFKGQIENFYTVSSQRFYQQVESQPVAVAKLSQVLYRAEKRQAKKEALAPYVTVG